MQPATTEALKWARDQHSRYTPSTATKEKLSNIALGMLVGPTAVGKSFLIDKVTEEDKHFSGMGTITTRAPRETDPDNYSHITVEEFTAMIEAGELVQYEIHPTTDDFYGSDANSFSTDLVIAPVLASGVHSFRKAGFKRATTIGIVSPASQWSERLAVHEDSDDLIKRLREARHVIQWLRRYKHAPDVAILNNTANDVSSTVSAIEYLTMGKDRPVDYQATPGLGKLIDDMQLATWHKLEELVYSEQK